MHELVTETTREAVAVAQALGYDIDFEERIDTILALLEKAGPSKASMLQDVEAGRRTEIDVINGAVVRAADERGVAVPHQPRAHAAGQGLGDAERARVSTRLHLPRRGELRDRRADAHDPRSTRSSRGTRSRHAGPTTSAHRT